MNVVITDYGAIGQAIHYRLQGGASVTLTHVVVRKQRLAAARAASIAAGSTVKAVAVVPRLAKLVRECAGHEALIAHFLKALKAGCECAVMSLGALAAPRLPERQSDAAKCGNTQGRLLSGAIGGIDALSAAR